MYTIAVGAAEFQLLAYSGLNFRHLIKRGSNIKETPRYQRKIKKEIET